VTTRLTNKRVRRVIEAYGSDPARWPARERAAARRLEHDPAIARTIEAQRRLDAALSTLEQPAPASDALHARLISLADTPQAAAASGWIRRLLPDFELDLTRRALAGEAATLAAALAAGLWLAASNLTVQADEMDLSPYVLGGEIALLDEGAQ